MRYYILNPVAVRLSDLRSRFKHGVQAIMSGLPPRRSSRLSNKRAADDHAEETITISTWPARVAPAGKHCKSV